MQFIDDMPLPVGFKCRRGNWHDYINKRGNGLFFWAFDWFLRGIVLRSGVFDAARERDRLAWRAALRPCSRKLRSRSVQRSLVHAAYIFHFEADRVSLQRYILYRDHGALIHAIELAGQCA